MKVAITLNDVVRDFTKSLKDNYKIFDTYRNENKSIDFKLPAVDENGNVVFDENGNAVFDEDVHVEEEIQNEPLYADQYIQKFINCEFSHGLSADEFLFNDFCFNIFGKSELTYPSAMNDLNELYTHIVNMGYQCTVLSQELSNSKLATLQFLSVNSCFSNNYKFLSSYKNVWDIYDVVITADIDIINNYFSLPETNDKDLHVITNNKNKSIEVENRYEHFNHFLETFKKSNLN